MFPSMGYGVGITMSPTSSTGPTREKVRKGSTSFIGYTLNQAKRDAKQKALLENPRSFNPMIIM